MSYSTLQPQWKGNRYTKATPHHRGIHPTPSHALKRKNSLTREALVTRQQYLAIGEADQRVVGLERRGRSPPTMSKKKSGFHVIGHQLSGCGEKRHLSISNFSAGGPGKRRTKRDHFTRLAEAFSAWVTVSYRGHLTLCPMKWPLQRCRPKRRG